ncbi:Mitochondrial import receptor subunit TOM7 homolog [Geodia barretti]|uniref:Mitochondrial import receptor subunit TOM7 homolog n=1 Tax=Geodia barretti TaxID=519541 RepID=A0AA35WRL1_GEOBA|nr:Mitochondrial import receptor subunit TOM7 homolog [Geodia barretti]
MWQQRLEQVLFVSRTAFKWGWIPLLLYLGIRRGATDPGVPPPSLFQALWVL